MAINLNTAIGRLFFIWLCCTVFLLSIIFLEVIGGKYGNNANSAWWWLITKLVPGNLLLLFGYVKYKHLSGKLTSRNIVLFKMSFYLSIAYLAAVILALLLQPLMNPESSESENLRATDTGLFIFQALAVIILGVFIYKTQKLPALVPDGYYSEFFDGKTRVFISYNHANKETANKLKSMLEKEKVDVIIDWTSMQAGEDIKSFIAKSVMMSQVTLAVVSRESLLSSWVSLETIETFYLEKFTKNKRFIAAYLDEDFFDLNFTAEAIQHIDKQLETVREQLRRHEQLGIDSRDLNTDKSRLIDMRNHMDQIIQRLRSSLCIDIRQEKLPETFPLLLKSIKKA